MVELRVASTSLSLREKLLASDLPFPVLRLVISLMSNSRPNKLAKPRPNK